MSDPTERLADSLKAAGHSVTKPRLVVFLALQGHEAQTMHELTLQCKEIDRASLYRTIELFESLGIVQRLQIGWKYKLELSGQFVHHHHHATCIVCGELLPLPEDSVLEKQLKRMAADSNFALKTHQLELSGVCEACQIKDKQKGAV